MGRRQLKGIVSIKGFNVTGGSPALESYMETKLYLWKEEGRIRKKDHIHGQPKC